MEALNDYKSIIQPPDCQNTSTVVRCSSSYRAVPLNVTIKNARKLASFVGISRVTNTTRLDRIGIPVFSSIRPGAAQGTLCVNAGKGVTEKEAEAGALMEAIEFAFAESGATEIPVISAYVQEIVENRGLDSILEFCPLKFLPIPYKAKLPCVEAYDLISNQPCLVPAELVFLPFRSEERQYFGCNSNGLASGNTTLEAMLHGIFEVIERDIRSFELVRDTSYLVHNESFPLQAKTLQKQIRSSGFELCVRWSENIFRIPYFRAVLYEPLCIDPIFVFAGFGCHLDAEVALTRAICEAVQSRLSFIHGGRDDLTRRYKVFENWNQDDLRSHAHSLIAAAASQDRSLSYDQIVSSTTPFRTLDDIFSQLTECLHRAKLRRICRVVYTQPVSPIQVVRVIVPGLEIYSMESYRVGPRLRDYAASP